MFDLQIKTNLDLLKKYDRPGPRYTSYPTAPYFHDGIGQKEFTEYINRHKLTKSGEDISLYFHLPFCDTLCYFCGCNMQVTKNQDRINEYVDYLIREMDILHKHVDKSRHVAQMHWGGGTPTSLSPDQIKRLGEAIRERFSFRKNAEISVEVDPRGLTYKHMEALSKLGFNRCSMGVQDFDPSVQEAVHRIQSEEITKQTIEWSRELGYVSINIDLMYGLPYQSLKNFESSIETVIDFNPDRLAVFNYAHLPQKIKHQKLIPDSSLPGPEEKLQLLKLSIDKLTEAGYIYIGMDHFAKQDDELTIALQEGTLYRNFQGYSTHAGLDLFSVGMSSISMLPEIYVQNYKKLDEYYYHLNQENLPINKGVRLSEDDVLRRDVIMELMCNFKLYKPDIEKKYNINFDQYFVLALKNLKEFVDDRLVTLDVDTIQVTNSGRLLIRNIAMNFDAYLQKQDGLKPQFSKTV